MDPAVARSRTPEDVFGHHGQTLMARDVPGIVEDYTEESVVISPQGKYVGKAEIARFFQALLDALPNAKWGVTPIFHDDVLFLEWTCESDTHKVTDGIDTFVFRDGMIAVQTARCTLVRPNIT